VAAAATGGEVPEVDRTPLVSVVIPVYNGEPFIRATLESVLAQTYPNFEVIVVNDGSTDGTPRVLESFGDRITCVSQPNRGLSATRNAGMTFARGEFLFFLDADDLLCRDYIERLAEPMLADEGVDATFCDTAFFREIEGERVPAGRTDRSRYAEDMFANLLYGSLTPGAAMYRRSSLRWVGGYDILLRAVEDKDFNLRLAKTASWHYVPEIALEYRMSVGSMSQQYWLMYEMDRYVILRHLRASGRKDLRRRHAKHGFYYRLFTASRMRARLKATHSAKRPLGPEIGRALGFLVKNLSVLPFLFYRPRSG
jgi:glycosyltransferase involved in cell wall biosynthesis